MDQSAIYIVADFLHTLATIIWIGGMTSNFLLIMPSAKKTLEPAQMGKFMSGLMKRFKWMVYATLLTLLATGVYLDLIADEALETDLMGSLMGVKHGIITVLVFLSLYSFEIFAPKVGKIAAQGPSPKLFSMQKKQMMIAMAAFVLALVVVFISV
ncbi:MAG: DUF4149 domain-containing protein, partial [Bacteroidetes bacterium]|nr:DUF4149 domain-containing protein [Bacteroidota bacterium]